MTQLVVCSRALKQTISFRFHVKKPLLVVHLMTVFKLISLEDLKQGLKYPMKKCGLGSSSLTNNCWVQRAAYFNKSWPHCKINNFVLLLSFGLVTSVLENKAQLTIK